MANSGFYFFVFVYAADNCSILSITVPEITVAEEAIMKNQCYTWADVNCYS